MSNILLVEVSSLAVRSSYVYNYDYSFNENKPFLGGILGFFREINAVCKQTDFSKVYLVFDSKPYVRQSVHKDYKANRAKNTTLEPYIRTTFRLLNELLEISKITNIAYSGAEADDIIASMVLASKDTCYILCPDSDLDQLFTKKPETIIIKKGSKGKKVFYTATDAEEKYGFSTDKLEKLLVNATSLTTGHNNYIRVRKGIGYKTALAKYLDDNLDIRMELFSEEEKLAIKTNRELINLPFEKLVTDSYLEYVDSVLKLEPRKSGSLDNFIEKYELKVENLFDTLLV